MMPKCWLHCQLSGESLLQLLSRSAENAIVSSILEIPLKNEYRAEGRNDMLSSLGMSPYSLWFLWEFA